MAMQRNRGRKTKELYDEKSMGDRRRRLVEYVKNIGLYYGL
jgi:hypothetical protein